MLQLLELRDSREGKRKVELREREGKKKEKIFTGARMQFLGRFCLLVAVCSALELHKRILKVFLGLFLMDFASLLKMLTRNSELKGGFLVLGCFSPVFNVFGLFLLFGLGLKLMQFTWQVKSLIQFFCEIRGKSGETTCGFCSEKGFDKVNGSKMISCECNSLEFLDNSKSGTKGNNLFTKKEPAKTNGDSTDDNEEVDNFVEDEEFDVKALKRLVKIERHRAEMAYAELEKERSASASAADEAMAMILRLQSEKSFLDIEANQYRRLAEQQREYDQEVIQLLQWIIMKYESEKASLEEKLELCEQKLKQCMDSDEVDEFERYDESILSLNVDSDMENGFEDVKTNSAEMDFSVS
ncbi:protein FLOURY 1-like isoform X1 [Jatropha curcas]|nr:protein FLOURY 1-like isoform X1 [Jatropha curcas]